MVTKTGAPRGFEYIPRKLSIASAMFCLSLQFASLPASAENAHLLAWGHKKEEQSANAAPTTTVAPVAPAAPAAVEPGSVTRSTTPAQGSGTVPGATVVPVVPTTPSMQPPVDGAPPAVPGPNGPVLTTPTSFIDLNSGRFAKLQVDLQKAQFRETSIDRASVTATDMDFRQGSLNALNIDVVGGHFQQFIFDEMILTTAGNLRFDPNVLLQEKVLQFATPARADVSVLVSQDSLNKFLADPHTLENLSVTVSKRLGALANLFGANVSNLGVNLKEAHITLAKANKIVIAITADLGMGGVGVPLSFEVDAQLGIKDGWVEVTDTHLMTNGQEISPQLSEMLVKKINSLASWGHKSDDIQFDFTEIKVVPGKQFSVKGTAVIKRLRLTSPKDASGVVLPPGAPGAGGLPAPTMPVMPNGGAPILAPTNQ